MIPSLAAAALLVTQPQPAADAFAVEQSRVALELYRRFDDRPGNVVFSPYSIARCFALVREGAAGATASELDRVLRLPPDAGGQAFHALDLALHPRRSFDDSHDVFELQLASAIFPDLRSGLEPSFLERTRKLFDAELTSVDFRQAAAARATINAWVAKQTHERIGEILPDGSVGADTSAVLVDTIYLHAAWQEAFDEHRVREQVFHAPAGRDVQASFLRKKDEFAVGETPLARFVEIPYERGELALVVVLPKELHGLAGVVAREHIADWVPTGGATQVDLALPKFHFEWGGAVTDAIKELGIRNAFDCNAADFSRMSKERVCIDAVFHRATIAVDEKGTEATAATAITMKRTSAAPDEGATSFVADEPFLFFIRHRATGAVLFMGRVEDPTAGV